MAAQAGQGAVGTSPAVLVRERAVRLAAARQARPQVDRPARGSALPREHVSGVSGGVVSLGCLMSRSVSCLRSGVPCLRSARRCRPIDLDLGAGVGGGGGMAGTIAATGEAPVCRTIAEYPVGNGSALLPPRHRVCDPTRPRRARQPRRRILCPHLCRGGGRFTNRRRRRRDRVPPPRIQGFRKISRIRGAQ